MGILRTDRVSGLGGANAIKGSVFFSGDLGSNGNYLSIGDSDDFSLGSGDFTIEAWIYANALSTNSYEGIIGQWPASGANANNSWVLEIVAGDLEFYYCHSGATLVGPIQGGSVKTNEWTHVMATRSGNTMYMFINGTAHDNNGQSVTHTFNDVTDDVTIGGYIANAAMWNGNISNVRVIKGTALHTSNFTVPTSELVKTSDTSLLACQSSGNVLQEATGKIISPRRTNNNSSYPTASRFTPNSPVGFSTTTDVGTQFGSTFNGVTTFDSQAYFVPPGGNTRERNRGRGIFMGGYVPGSYTRSIDTIEIQSTGNAIDFGDTSSTSVGEGASCSSTTRAVQGGGSFVNTMEFVTIANSSNTTDFGDLTVVRRSLNSLSSETRGIWAGGTTNPAMSDVIDFATIATAGNATDFGNLTVGRRNMAPMTSPTRGVFAGGNPGSSPLLDDTIDFITIASAGNAQDFGNLITAMREQGGSSSATRGLIAGGYTSPANLNTIEFITIASTGNASDFGDLYEARSLIGGTSNATRGIFAGGSYTNTIQFVTIATTGNAADFGDLTIAKALYGATSDSHGGIS